MRVLAIDTALGACAACVIEHERAEPLSLESVDLDRGHAEALMPLIARVMERVEGGFPSLARIAVTIGPGSFTGLRVGMAAARAIGLGAGKPVVGVSTLAACCAPLVGRETGRVIAASIDARHGQVYFQALGASGILLAPARQCSLKDAVRTIGAGPVSLVGPGAMLVAQEAWALGLDAVVVNAAPSPDIRWVARLGLLADPATAVPKPLYMRAPEARAQENGKVQRLANEP